MRQKALRKVVAVLIAALPLTVTLVIACVSDQAGNKGAKTCDRASECAAGLIGAANVYRPFLSKLDGGTAANFNDTGTMPMVDGAADGPAPDAPPGDGPPPGDTGTPPVDTGTMPVDTGTMPIDTGTMPIDTGTAPTDTGTTPPDDTSAGD